MYINIICFYRAEPSMINYLQLRWHFNLEITHIFGSPN